MAKFFYPPAPGNGAGTFSDNLVGNQFTDGSSFATLGNFSISSSGGEQQSFNLTFGGFSEAITLDTLSSTEQEALISSVNSSLLVRFNYDYNDISSLVQYGSLRERIRVAVQQIINFFPATLYCNGINQQFLSTGNTTQSISYDIINDETTVVISRLTIDNPFSIEFTTNGLLGVTSSMDTQYINIDDNDIISTVAQKVSLGEVTPLRNFSLDYRKYVLSFDGSGDTEYQVIDYAPIDDFTENLTIVISGSPFGLTPSPSTTTFYLKPNKIEFQNSFDKFDTVEKFLVNQKTVPQYTSTFKVLAQTDQGQNFILRKEYTWPKSDNVNIDISSDSYTDYLQNLVDISNEIDENKTNLVSRFLTTGALKEFDTGDRKVEKSLQIYGRSFDDTKKFIDGIAYMTNVTYDGFNNVPNNLLRNFANLLGWETPSTLVNKDFLDTVLNVNPSEFTGESIGLTPAELDIELYRRILMNTAYLFKSKGTRKAIEFLLSFIGAPESMIEFNEHVVLADRKIDLGLGTETTTIFQSNCEGKIDTTITNDLNSIVGGPINEFISSPEVYEDPIDSYIFTVPVDDPTLSIYGNPSNFCGGEGGFSFYLDRIELYSCGSNPNCGNDPQSIVNTLGTYTSWLDFYNGLVGFFPVFSSFQSNDYNGIISRIKGLKIDFNIIPSPCICSQNTLTVGGTFPAFNGIWSNISGGVVTTPIVQFDQTIDEFGGTIIVSPEYSTHGFIREDYPIDNEGYPTKPRFTSNYFFQNGAGWYEETLEHRGNVIIDLENSVFSGCNPNIVTKLNQFSWGGFFGNLPFGVTSNDPGAPYLERFRRFPYMHLGFGVTPKIDDKKSWVEVEPYPNLIGYVGNIPLWRDYASAQLHAANVGCGGYHTHMINGEVGYMACLDHETALEVVTPASIPQPNVVDHFHTFGNLRYADYTTSDERLIINVKNTDIFLNPSQSIIYDIWKQSSLSGCPFDGNPLPPSYYGSGNTPVYYPGLGGVDSTETKLDAKKFSFKDFIDGFVQTFINVKNRQTIDDGKTGGYPTLQMLFLDYVKKKCGDNNEFRYNKLFNYVNSLGTYWIKIVEQFVPSTTLWQGGVRVENSLFHRDKFVYKHNTELLRITTLPEGNRNSNETYLGDTGSVNLRNDISNTNSVTSTLPQTNIELSSRSNFTQLQTSDTSVYPSLNFLYQTPNTPNQGVNNEIKLLLGGLLTNERVIQPSNLNPYQYGSNLETEVNSGKILVDATKLIEDENTLPPWGYEFIL